MIITTKDNHTLDIGDDIKEILFESDDGVDVLIYRTTATGVYILSGLDVVRIMPQSEGQIDIQLERHKCLKN